MVAWIPLARRAVKFAPVALEVGRQVDRQVRPHLLAYRKASEIDGHVGRFTDDEGATHWVVFRTPGGDPVASFPPLSSRELARAGAQLDHRRLAHHSELPEAKALGVAQGVARLPKRVRGRRDD